MEPYFDNIRERIIDELTKAEYQILVVVAWITDTKIIDTLAERARQGIKVEILISAKTFDEKHKERQGSYTQYLFLSKCLVYKIGTDEDYAPLMHHKFCVIDNHVLITGSFNWTGNASRNDEDIILNDDFAVAQKYVDRFKELKQKISKERLWFNQLAYSWQQLLREKISIEHEPTENDLKKIAGISELDISADPLSMRQDWEEEYLNNLIENEKNLTEHEIQIYKFIVHNEFQTVNDLTPISFLKNLRVLNCSGTDIKSLEPLSELISLEILVINEIEGVELDLLHLKNLKNLKALQCGCSQLKNWDAVKYLENLESISFMGSFAYMTNKNITSLEPLRHLKKLKKIDIGGLQVSDLEPISNLSELEDFQAEGTLINDVYLLKR